MIEFELKALVKDYEEIEERIEEKYDMSRCVITYSEQLNHYFSFSKEALDKLLNTFENPISWEIYDEVHEYEEALLNASKIAIRTRWDSKKGTILILKYSLVDNNAENGSIRKELEVELKGVTLFELDKVLLDYGFTYQSKWSRNRKQYDFDSGWTLCLDENAGYGSLLEVEYLATEEYYEVNKDYIRFKANKFLQDLNLVELSEGLLNEMFLFYSANFNDFYGTNKLIWDDHRFFFNRDGSSKLFGNVA